VAIAQTCGKFDRVLEPGCHCVPYCIGSLVAGKLSLRVQQLDVRCETKTKVRRAPARAAASDPVPFIKSPAGW